MKPFEFKSVTGEGDSKEYVDVAVHPNMVICIGRYNNDEKLNVVNFQAGAGTQHFVTEDPLWSLVSEWRQCMRGSA